MTDTSTNPNLLGGAAERRAFRDRMSRGIEYFIPPELRPLLGFAAEMTPSAAVERGGAASMRAVQPDRTAMERLGDIGEVLSETAAIGAPVAVAGRAAMPAAQAAQEAFLGVSVPARAAADTVIERLNQPGPMPETLYSGFDPTAMLARRNAQESSFQYDLMVRNGVDPEIARQRVLRDYGVDPVPRPPDPLPPPRNAREETSDEIARLLREGKDAEAEALLDLADDRRLYQLYERGEVGRDLPVDFASAQARGREMGFVEEYFKGMYPYDPDTVPVRNWRGEIIEGADRTPRELTSINRPTDFPSFNRGEPGYQIAGVMGRDPNVANNFAAWPESAVYPLQVRHGRTYDMDAAGSRAGLTHFEESGRPFRDQMRSGQFDTGVIRNTSDEGDIAFVLRPENIRSRFARFDPRFAGSGNLMAGVGGLGAFLAAPDAEEAPAVRNYRDGGEVFRGIGSLTSVARGMFGA